jgi:hypothetical protein
VSLGLWLSSTKSELDPAWADAIETDPASVPETEYQMNAERSEQRALDRIAERGY